MTDAFQIVFPITFRAYDNGHYIENPPCRRSFLQGKPADMSWYAFDCAMDNMERARFAVYGIGDVVYGGIGHKTGEFSADLLYDDAVALVRLHARDEARLIERAEFEGARSARRNEIAQSFLASVGARDD